MTKIILADHFEERWQSVSFTDPFTGEQKQVDGELVDFTNHNGNDYFHKNDLGEFEKREWYDDDITHIGVHYEDDYIVVVPYTK